MPTEISALDQSIIRNSMLSKSHKEIAALLDLQVEEVYLYISQVVKDTGVVTRQMRQDLQHSKKASLPKAAKPIKEKPAKKVDSVNEIARQNMATQKPEKQQMEKLRKDQERERRGALAEKKYRRLPTKFKDLEVDYSKLNTIRIDRKTVIYCKPGQDPEAVKKRFLKNYSKVLKNNIDG
jgi:hypothetical protein